MSRVIAAFAQFFDSAGDPLENGWLEFIVSGTTSTAKNTYSDENLTIANANPLQLDADGRAGNVFGQGVYKVKLYENNPVTKAPGNLIQEFDPVYADVIPTGASGNFAEWDYDTTYEVNNIVSYAGFYYQAILGNNQGNVPSVTSAYWERIAFIHWWNAASTYLTGEIAVYNGALYISLQDNNLNNQPDISPLYWDIAGAGTILLNWEEDGTTLRPKVTGYDLGDVTHLLGDIYLQDNSNLYFGNAQDARIYYDGTHGYFTVDNGAINLNAQDGVNSINFKTAGTDKWRILTSGTLMPASADAINLGGTSNEIRSIFLGDVGAINFGLGQDAQILFNGSHFNILVNSGAANMYLNNAGTGSIYFQTASVSKWRITNYGNFLPQAADSYDIGSDSLEVRSIYVGDAGRIYFGLDQDFKIYFDASNAFVLTDTGNLYLTVDHAVGQLYLINNSQRWQLNGSGHFFPYTTKTQDLGASSYLIRHIYQGDDGYHYFGDDQDAYITHNASHFHIKNATGNIYIGPSASDNLVLMSANANRWMVDTAGHFKPALSNTYNIGAAGTPVQHIYQGDNGYHYLGDSADMFLVYGGSSGTLKVSNGSLNLTSGDSGLSFYTQSTHRWSMWGSDGRLVPQASGTHLGATGNLLGNIYSGDSGIHYFGDDQDADIYWDNTLEIFVIRNTLGDFDIKNTDIVDGRIRFYTSNTVRWMISNAGNLLPNVADTYNLGGTGAEILNAYIGDAGKLYFGLDQDFSIWFDGTSAYQICTTGHLLLGTDTGAFSVYVRTNNANRWVFQEDGDLVPDDDNTYEIGNSLKRVQNIYVNNAPTDGDHLCNKTYVDSVAVGVSGWSTDANYNFYPDTADFSDLGTITNTVKHIYQGDGDYIYQGAAQDASIGWVNASTLWALYCSAGNVQIGTTADYYLGFRVNDSVRWIITGLATNYCLRPNIADSYDLGSTDYEIKNLYIGAAGKIYLGTSQPYYIEAESALVLGTTSNDIKLVCQDASSEVTLWSNNTERWRCTAAGNWVPQGANTYNIGSTSNEVALIYAYGVYFGTTQHGYVWNNGSSTYVDSIGDPLNLRTTDANDVNIYTDSALAAKWDDSASAYVLSADWAFDNVYAYNNAVTGLTLEVASTGIYGKDSSTVRTKRDVKTLNKAKDKDGKEESTLSTDWLYDLELVEFKFNLDVPGADDRIHIGFLAEDVEKVYPHICFYEPDPDNGGKEIVSGILWKQLSPAIINEMQKLRDRIEQLEAQLPT